jgi:hypothetical protein
MGVWTEYVRRPYEAAQSGNPRAEVGHEGVYASGIQVGSDFWQFAPYCRVTGRYNSILEEWYRSVNPEIIHGQYGGYGVDQITPGIRFFPWRTLFHGGHWVFYYMLWDQAQPYQMIIDFDGSPHGGYPALSREEWADIKSGIGKLFIETRFTDDAIALPYSVASIYCGEMCGVGHRGSLYTHKGIIQELGYQHTSVSTEQIAEGELLRRGFRLLFLPATICLSDKAIAAVSEFAGKGGVVVADYAAGVRDEHGKRRSSVPLDDLFGIDRSAATEPTRSLELSFGPSAPEPTRPLRAAMRPGESGLKAAKGQAWAQFEDGTAALVVRKHNDGYAVYTNIDLSAYGSSKGAGVRGEVIVETRGAEDYVKAVQAVFRQIFDLAKTPRRVTVLRDGKPFDHGETFYHTDATGQPLYVGLMMDVPESQAVEVRFHRPSHIYDVRDGIYLGRTDHFTDEFHPGRVQVYAALPYEVTGVTLAVDRPGPEAAFAPGSDVTVRAQVRAGSGQPLLHVFRIEVFRPDGQPDGAYTANHRAEAGALKWTIPMAYNAAPGTWKVVARDIVSGQRASVSFEVTP